MVTLGILCGLCLSAESPAAASMWDSGIPDGIRLIEWVAFKTLIWYCWVGGLLLLGLRSRVRNQGYWPATGVFNTTVWTLPQTVQKILPTISGCRSFTVPFSFWGNSFSCACKPVWGHQQLPLMWDSGIQAWIGQDK
jgi:hypothetical protein